MVASDNKLQTNYQARVQFHLCSYLPRPAPGSQSWLCGFLLPKGVGEDVGGGGHDDGGQLGGEGARVQTRRYAA